MNDEFITVFVEVELNQEGTSVRVMYEMEVTLEMHLLDIADLVADHFNVFGSHTIKSIKFPN